MYYPSVYYYNLIESFSLSDLKRLMTSAYVDRVVCKRDIEKSRTELLRHLRHLLYHNLYPALKDKIVQFQSEWYRQTQSRRRRSYRRQRSPDQRKLSRERSYSPDERPRRRRSPSYSRDPRYFRRQLSKSSLSPNQMYRMEMDRSYDTPYSHRISMSRDCGSGAIQSPTYSDSSLQFSDHPHVHFTSLPFFKVVSPIIKPSPLVALRKGQLHKEYYFYFTTEQLHRLQHFPEVQVQLRICPLNEAEEQEDEIPGGTSIKVNVHTYLFPPDKSDVSPIHCLKIPIDISQVVKRSESEVNTILITWNKHLEKQYVLTVNLVAKLSSDHLVQHLSNEKVQSPIVTVDLIKKALHPTNDSDITTESFEISMICPLGKNKVKLPSRAITCEHLQCFEASLYLKMNELKEKWVCPICNKPALFKDLIVDGLFQEILSKLPEEFNEVEFDKDGSWRPITTNTNSLKSKVSRNQSKKRKLEISLEETSSHPKVPVIELEPDESTLTLTSPIVSTEKRPIIVFLDSDTQLDLSVETSSYTNIVHDHATQLDSSPIVPVSEVPSPNIKSIIDLDSDIELVDSDIEIIE